MRRTPGSQEVEMLTRRGWWYTAEVVSDEGVVGIEADWRGMWDSGAWMDNEGGPTMRHIKRLDIHAAQ